MKFTSIISFYCNFKLKINMKILILIYYLVYISTMRNYAQFDKLIASPPQLENQLPITFGQLDPNQANPEFLHPETLIKDSDNDFHNNTIAQGIVANAKLYESLLSSGNAKTIEDYVKAQEQQYQDYFNEINKQEYQKVYSMFNQSNPTIKDIGTSNVTSIINLPDSPKELTDIIK
jgi:hypothetical protein